MRVFSNMFTAHGAVRSDDRSRAGVCACACSFIFARTNFGFETSRAFWGTWGHFVWFLFEDWKLVLWLRSESRLGSAGGNPNSPLLKLDWVRRNFSSQRNYRAYLIAEYGLSLSLFFFFLHVSSCSWTLCVSYLMCMGALRLRDVHKWIYVQCLR